MHSYLCVNHVWMCVVLHILYLNLAEKILGRFKRVKIFLQHKIFVCVWQPSRQHKRGLDGDMVIWNIFVLNQQVWNNFTKNNKVSLAESCSLAMFHRIYKAYFLNSCFLPNKTIKMFFITFIIVQTLHLTPFSILNQDFNII